MIAQPGRRTARVSRALQLLAEGELFGLVTPVVTPAPDHERVADQGHQRHEHDRPGRPRRLSRVRRAHPIALDRRLQLVVGVAVEIHQPLARERVLLVRRRPAQSSLHHVLIGRSAPGRRSPLGPGQRLRGVTVEEGAGLRERRSVLARPRLVGRQEAALAGEQEPAHAGLLIEHRGEQRLRDHLPLARGVGRPQLHAAGSPHEPADDQRSDRQQDAPPHDQPLVVSGSNRCHRTQSLPATALR